MNSTKIASRRTQSAIRKIDLFEKRFGKAHLYLAYHAAFPLSLTPDLLYRLWSHFQQDIYGHSLNIPWSAVADFLLSNLCEAVGHELYEIENTVREELLRRLKDDPDFSAPDSDQNRIMQLADFLLEYVEQQVHSDDPDAQAFAQAQQWLALSYTRPGKTVEKIAQTLRNMQTTTKATSANEPELLRLASLVETLSEPLAEAGLTPLLVYFRGIDSFARGDLDAAATQLESIAESGKIEIGGEILPIPESIRARWNLTNESTVADFSDHKLRGHSFKNQDLTGANFSRADLRGANFNGAKLAGANFSNTKMGMQRRWAIWLTIFCFLLALFLGVGIVLVGLSFGGSLIVFDGSYGSSSSTKFSSAVFSNLIRWSSIYFGGAFACFYVTSTRKKSWQTFWKAYTLAFMFSPISLIISTFLAGLSVRNNAQSISMIVSDSVCAVLFGFCGWSITYKGLKVRWIASAIALIGITYLGTGISISLSAIWNSLRVWSIVGAIASFLLVLVIVRDGSRAKTFTDVFMKSGRFALIFSLITITVIWIVSQNPLLALAGGSLAFIVSIVLVVFLVWSGVLDLRKAIFSIITACIVAAISSGLYWIASNSSGWGNFVGSIFLLILALTGLIVGLSLAITISLSITIVWAESGDQKFAMIWTSILIAIPIALTGFYPLIFGGYPLVIAGTGVFALAILQLGIYIGFQTTSGDPKFASIRQAALTITSLCGTNFCGADLSEANLTQSILKSVNFKQANLTHAKWFRAKYLDRASTGDNYLQYPQIQQILTSRKAQGQNFDHLDLRGINLRRFNLSGASFVGTNLQDADLRQVDLSEAKLIKTQLEGTNLSGAILTGIHFHDCKFTTATTLAAVECDYIYTMPDRPTSETPELSKEVRFRPGGFANFVRNTTEPHGFTQ